MPLSPWQEFTALIYLYVIKKKKSWIKYIGKLSLFPFLHSPSPLRLFPLPSSRILFYFSRAFLKARPSQNPFTRRHFSLVNHFFSSSITPDFFFQNYYFKKKIKLSVIFLYGEKKITLGTRFETKKKKKKEGKILIRYFSGVVDLPKKFEAFVDAFEQDILRNEAIITARDENLYPEWNIFSPITSGAFPSFIKKQGGQIRQSRFLTQLRLGRKSKSLASHSKRRFLRYQLMGGVGG